jgi:hypothetical protein
VEKVRAKVLNRADAAKLEVDGAAFAAGAAVAAVAAVVVAVVVVVFMIQTPGRC